MTEHVGAYGFRLDPAVFGRRYLHEAGTDWPALTVRIGAPGRGAHGWREAFSGEGWAVHTRPGSDEVSWSGEGQPDRDGLIHPLLALAVCAVTLERGGDCLHGGAVLTHDGVVAVLAPAGGGKTSTMAWLALRAGLEVFTDDHLNVRDGLAHAGPRCLDLRADAAQRLDLERGSRIVRGDERRRFELPPVRRASAPVVRTVVLAWGPRVRVEPVPPRERLGIVATHRTAQPVDGNLAVPLALAALPMVRLERPKTFDCMDEVAEAVLNP
ncbi:hypothetical protein Val02_91700 [Virgisporangium aliadipatigenens]|uniref:HPr kinase n=1 Tax=Virgisporangium aliadipatigenens TaxID=741659 RepID=A0A8J4DVY0_9ACTN|nr:hypothetical protein [Virgisporangium aliadipatigenens]GIJ52284.1 hypothetical protein Val02_91700 [Virgisporangium aliadipatigenens]